jgi:hypothetical protein
MSSAEENNKALVRRFIEEFYNRGTWTLPTNCWLPTSYPRRPYRERSQHIGLQARESRAGSHFL